MLWQFSQWDIYVLWKTGFGTLYNLLIGVEMRRKINLYTHTHWGHVLDQSPLLIYVPSHLISPFVMITSAYCCDLCASQAPTIDNSYKATNFNEYNFASKTYGC